MATHGCVTYDVDEGVGHVRLNRPDAANAFHLDMTRAFADVMAEVDRDNNVRAVLVSGAGSRCCAGGDVASLASAADQPAYIHQLAVELGEAFQSVAALAKPVVCAVQGAVAGAGLALMMSCDIIIATPETKFAFAYPGIGFTPDCGVSYLLPRAIGRQRALAFALQNKPANATKALEWGLIHEVSIEPLSRAAETARTHSAGPAFALGQTRCLLRQGCEMSPAEPGAEEARTITEMVRGAETQDLIRRFVSR